MKFLYMLEYAGTLLAAVGFTMLSMGFLLYGFVTGLLSCLFLIAYFSLHHFNMKGLLALQVFFLCVNILGIYNNF